MKKFFTYLIILLLGFAVLDLLNRAIISVMVSQVPHDAEINRKYRFETNEKKADLLIIGASRGVYSYDTELMSEKLNLNCISISVAGMGVIDQYLCLKRAIRNNVPRIVIYDMSPAQLSHDWVYNQISAYFPFYWTNNDVHEVVNTIIGKKAPILLSSSFIQYNSILYDLMKDGFLRKANDKNGYEALKYTGKGFKFEPDDSSDDLLDVDSLGCVYLQRIVDICTSNGVRLIICDSPRLNKIQKFHDFILGFSHENNVEFWDFSNLERVTSDNRLFVDKLHINSEGARLFTNELIYKLGGQ